MADLLKCLVTLLALGGFVAGDEPVPLAIGELQSFSLAEGETRVFVIEPAEPGLLNLDAKADGGGVSVRAADMGTIVLAEMSAGENPFYKRISVEAVPGRAVLLEVSSANGVASQFHVTCTSGVEHPTYGDGPSRAQYFLELGDSLESMAWFGQAAIALHYSAEADYAERDFRACEEKYERVLQLATQVGHQELVTIARVRLGTTYIESRGAPAAIEHLEPTLEEVIAQGNRALEILVRTSLAQARVSLGELQVAREMLGAALELARALNEQSAAHDLQRALGRVEWAAGRTVEARELFDAATTGARESREIAVLAPALLAEAEFRSRTGEFSVARLLLEEALALELPASFRAELLGVLGNVESDTGNDALAIGHFWSAISAASELGDDRLMRVALLNLGIAHASVGEWDLARARLSEALELLSADSQPALRSMALRALGEVRIETGELLAAAPLVDEALALAEEVAMPEILAGALASRIAFLMKTDRLESAVDSARALSELGRSTEHMVHEAVGLDLEAEIRLRQGELAAARPLSDRALTLLRQSGDAWLLQWSLLTAFELAHLAGEADLALAYVEEAEDCFASSGLQGADPERLANRRATDVYSMWGDYSQDAAALKLSEAGLSSEERAALTELSFQRAGFWKGRSLLLAMSEHRAGARTGESMAMRREIRDARAHEDQILASLGEAQRERAEARELSLRAELEIVRARRLQLEERWREHAPADVALEFPEGIAVDELSKWLTAEDVLIEFASGTSQLYAYSLSDGRLTFRTLGDRATIEETLAAFLQGISSPDRLAPPAAVASLGSELFGTLLAPLLPTDSSDRLVIIPTPELAVLPFEALVEEAKSEVSSFDDVAFVLDRREVSYASSTSVLALLAELGPRSQPGPALVLADPIYASESGSYERDASVARQGFDRLVGTRAEALAILSVLTAGEDPEDEEEGLSVFETERSFSLIHPAVELHLGEEASPAQLAGDLRRYAILHCASHGVVDSEDPGRSGLVLSASKNRGGLLTVAEILELDLDADLAVLSACETGRGEVKRSEGVQSLARAFFYAGARSVISSLWQVDDRETKEIMTRFYELHIGSGLPSAMALRQARLVVRRGTDASGHFRGIGRGLTASATKKTGDERSTTSAADRVGHPFFWASFIYMGRPN